MVFFSWDCVVEWIITHKNLSEIYSYVNRTTCCGLQGLCLPNKGLSDSPIRVGCWNVLSHRWMMVLFIQHFQHLWNIFMWQTFKNIVCYTNYWKKKKKIAVLEKDTPTHFNHLLPMFWFSVCLFVCLFFCILTHALKISGLLQSHVWNSSSNFSFSLHPQVQSALHLKGI